MSSQPRLIAIGDIHGCLAALNALLDALKPGPDDTVVTLGDYVDRGPDSRGVIERLILLSTQTHLVPIIGNHEQMMMDVLQGTVPHSTWIPHGGVETLDSYGFVGELDFLPESHRQFIDSMVDYYETDTHIFVHANYDPQLPLDNQQMEMIRWRSLRDYLPDPHQSGKIAVVGHTANFQARVLNFGYLIALDTYCYGGGVLTALEVSSARIWQANAAGELETEGEILPAPLT